MQISVVIREGEDGMVLASCPQLPGCHSQGATREEALANIREAIAACIETRRELGWPDLEETVELELAL